MKIDEQFKQYILSLPITTNRIDVNCNEELFFSKYSIVSYYGVDKKSKNMAYEQLADTQCLSVSGIRARWTDGFPAYVQFFVLCAKGEERNIIDNIRKYNFVRSKIDNLGEYDERLKKRILASLAINSLGKRKNDKMMYHNGSLLVCDDKNFNIKASKRELVCLKIEVNEYMHLTASTTSFSNPHSLGDLKNNRGCVFKISKDIGSYMWAGRSVKPIVIRNWNIPEKDLNDYYINKKRFRNNKNVVPYWPYNQENYTHGKLFVIWQVMDSVNEAFKYLLKIQFSDFNVLYFDECETKKDMLSFLHTYYSGKSIRFEDPFKTSGSHQLISLFKKESQELMGGTLKFPSKASSEDMIIKLCESQDEDLPVSHYTKSLYRLAHSGNALQHIVYHGNEKKDIIKEAMTKRILVELLVKDSLINRKLVKQLSDLIQGWQFFRYKINDGFVHGASLSVDTEGKMDIREYGLSQNSFGEDFNSFVQEYLKYEQCEKIRGSRDYMALIKEGNVYLIIDTDEIPILDANLIDEGYDDVINKGITVSMFKRKNNIHKYLRGFIGLHIWKSDGIDGEPNESFSYIVGKYSGNITIAQNEKMDKMPRARRIFILRKENPSAIEKDIMSIASMLKLGFGRWNEMMTYPFPFKFLQEYLDDACEIAFSKHWKDITYSGDL